VVLQRRLPITNGPLWGVYDANTTTGGRGTALPKKKKNKKKGKKKKKKRTTTPHHPTPKEPTKPTHPSANFHNTGRSPLEIGLCSSQKTTLAQALPINPPASPMGMRLRTVGSDRLQGRILCILDVLLDKRRSNSLKRNEERSARHRGFVVPSLVKDWDSHSLERRDLLPGA